MWQEAKKGRTAWGKFIVNRVLKETSGNQTRCGLEFLYRVLVNSNLFCNKTMTRERFKTPEKMSSEDIVCPTSSGCTLDETPRGLHSVMSLWWKKLASSHAVSLHVAEPTYDRKRRLAVLAHVSFLKKKRVKAHQKLHAFNASQREKELYTTAFPYNFSKLYYLQFLM